MINLTDVQKIQNTTHHHLFHKQTDPTRTGDPVESVLIPLGAVASEVVPCSQRYTPV